MVAKAGLEPALLYRKSILSRQRLPIPPLGRMLINQKIVQFLLQHFQQNQMREQHFSLHLYQIAYE